MSELPKTQHQHQQPQSAFILKAKCFLVVLVLYFTSTFGSTYMLFPFTFLLFLNRSLYHSFCDLSLRIWFGLAVFLLEKVCKIKIYLHESKKMINKENNDQKSSIIIMNHRTRLDWLFFFCILYRMKALTKIKIILKDVLKKIPGPGWAMQCALFIFIKRKWETDRLILNNFIHYFNDIGKQVYILIFPEGTNLTKETKVKSDKFAESNNLKPYNQVLYPRVTGFIHVFNEMNKNNQIDCIQDVTVAYRGGHIPETEKDFLTGRLPHEIHFYIEKFDIKSMFDANNNDPDEKNKNVEKWINERWRLKEEFLNKFYENDSEFEELCKSNYETRHQSESESNLLLIYPIYWVVTSFILFYLIYSYILFKILIVSAFIIYTYLQFFTNGIDDFIMNKSRGFVSANASYNKQNIKSE